MITSVGSLGSTNLKAGSTPITFSPSRSVAAGKLVVVWSAYDSAHNVADPHGPMQKRWRCSDDEGNVFCTVGAYISVGGDFFQTGVAGHLFLCQLTNPWTTGSTLTVECQADPNLTAKALSVWEFQLGAGKVWAVTDRAPQVNSNEDTFSTDPAVISVDDLTEQEYLALHLLASEGPDTDAFTWDGTWTEIDPDGTTGGADDSNVSIRGGFKIDTDTSFSIDVSSDTADRDWAQVMVAVCEVPAQTFPTPGVLDNFNRADENPLDNGTWRTDVTAGPNPGDRFLQIVSNQAQGDATNAGGQFWDEIFEHCTDVYVSIPVAGSASNAGVDVLYHASGDSSTNTLEGQGVSWWYWAGVYWGIEVGGLFLSGRVLESDARLRAHIDLANGYKLGGRRRRPSTGGVGIEYAFVDIGAGWQCIGAVYANRVGLVAEFGWIGCAVWDGTTELDNFGGGQFPCSRFRPQIIRHTQGVS